MVRTRSTTAPRARRSTAGGRRATVQTSVVHVAQQMLSEVEVLVTEVESLRGDNQTLRAEISDAVSMLEQVSEALSSVSGPTQGRRGGRRAEGAPAPRTRVRVTPEGVTPQLVHTVIGKLGGDATAAEIAAEISRTRAPVSGRAVRFLAERAGAETVVGEDGQRRYRVG
jgi:hypothetical protein